MVVDTSDVRTVLILSDILHEMQLQNQKWGENRVQNGLLWNGILTEEVGEATKEMMHQDNVLLRAELVQAAAVVVQWIRAIDRGEMPDWY